VIIYNIIYATSAVNAAALKMLIFFLIRHLLQPLIPPSPLNPPTLAVYLTCINLKIKFNMKLQTQLKVKERLMAAARGSCRKISPTTMNGIGPDRNKIRLFISQAIDGKSKYCKHKKFYMDCHYMSINNSIISKYFISLKGNIHKKSSFSITIILHKLPL
jgi:hypothetical protein